MRFSSDTGFRILVSCFIRSSRRSRHSSSNVSRSILKCGFHRTSSWSVVSRALNQFCGLGQAQALLCAFLKFPCLRRILKRTTVRNRRLSPSCTKLSMSLSRRNMRSRIVIWLTNNCKCNKQTAAAKTVIFRLLGLISNKNASLLWSRVRDRVLIVTPLGSYCSTKTCRLDDRCVSKAFFLKWLSLKQGTGNL